MDAAADPRYVEMFQRTWAPAVILATAVAGPEHAERVTIEAFARTLERWHRLARRPDPDSDALGRTAAEAERVAKREEPSPGETPPMSVLPGHLERQRLLAAIGARAGEIRARRRRRSLGAMSSALVLFMVVTAVRLGGADSTLATGSTSTSASGFGIADRDDAEPATFPTSSTYDRAPVAPRPASSSTSSTRGPTSSSSPPTTSDDTRHPGDRADGTPGWFNDRDTCEQSHRLPADGGPPDPALALSIAVDAATVRSGGTLTVTLTILNRSDHAVTVFYRTPASRTDAWLLSSRDVAASLTMTQGDERRDFVVVPPKAVEPGKVSMSRTVQAAHCGDTSSDAPVGLTPSSYLVGASLDVAVAITSALTPWRSPVENVTVTG